MPVFGSTCWVLLRKSHMDGKFGNKAAKGVFLGYPDGSKAYKVILDDGKVVKALSVVFAETNVSEVAEVAEELPGDENVGVETGLRSASDGEDVDADNDDKDDKQDDGSHTSPRTTIKVVAALKTRCVGAAERGDPLSSTGAR